MIALTMTEIEGKAAILLPEDAEALLGAACGDTVYMTRGADGAVRLLSHAAVVAEEVAMGEAIMERYSETFQALVR